jgi:DNA-binding NtrC family response regulator
LAEDRASRLILVVDDEEQVVRGVSRILRANGFENVATTSDAPAVPGLVAGNPPAVLLLDLVMPRMGGKQILEIVRQSNPEVMVIVVTAEQDARTAVECMKLGAYDYLLKPAPVDELIATISRALEHWELMEENRSLRASLLDRQAPRSAAFQSIFTVDEAMERIFSYLETVARGAHPVLITGETGTGKELIARALHRASGRKGPFIAVNVAGLDDAMFSDTLFGHRVGAFTGATTARSGMVEQAAGGTLFLDEIGDLPESSQVKLLRLLQEREYFPLGADSPKRMDARVVAATHQNTSALRKDLYYRLRSYHVSIPPLRERLGDLPLLVEHFVAEAAADLGKQVPPVSPEFVRALGHCSFPGNVRELRAIVFDALARLKAEILGRETLIDPHSEASGPESPAGSRSLDDALGDGEVVAASDWRRLERRNIVNALARCNWKISGKSGAAELLGLSPSTLESRMKAFAIEREKG